MFKFSLTGNYEIEHIDQLSKRLYNQYGSIVKMEGLLGRPDMLFLFDPDDIERVFRQEDLLPFRPSMPSLNYYKHVHRKEFFADNAGVIAVYVHEINLIQTNSLPFFRVNCISMYERNQSDLNQFSVTVRIGNTFEPK